MPSPIWTITKKNNYQEKLLESVAVIFKLTIDG